MEAIRIAGEFKNRNLPSLAAATKESLSFFARVSGLIRGFSCNLIICSAFLDEWFTSRDCERPPPLRQACR
jgi:hypothetical protein